MHSDAMRRRQFLRAHLSKQGFFRILFRKYQKQTTAHDSPCRDHPCGAMVKGNPPCAERPALRLAVHFA